MGISGFKESLFGRSVGEDASPLGPGSRSVGTGGSRGQGCQPLGRSMWGVQEASSGRALAARTMEWVMWPGREPRCLQRTTAALSGQAGSSRRKAFGMDEHDDVQVVERKAVSMCHRPDSEGREMMPDPFLTLDFRDICRTCSGWGSLVTCANASFEAKVIRASFLPCSALPWRRWPKNAWHNLCLTPVLVPDASGTRRALLTGPPPLRPDPVDRRADPRPGTGPPRWTAYARLHS